MRRLGNDRDLFLLKKKKKNIGAWTKKSFRIEKNFDLCKTTPAPSIEPPLGESTGFDPKLSFCFTTCRTQISLLWAV